MDENQVTPYPAGLLLRGRRVVVVGGGQVAQRRVPTLIAAGSSALYDVLEDAQRAAGVRLNYKYEVHQVQTEISMAAAGLGVAILPRIALPAHPDPRLRAVPIIDPPLSRELCVITLRGQSLPPVAAHFVQLLEKMFASADAA